MLRWNLFIAVHQILCALGKFVRLLTTFLNLSNYLSLLIIYSILIYLLDVGNHLFTGLLEHYPPMVKMFIGLVLEYPRLVFWASVLPVLTCRYTLILTLTFPM